MPKGVQATRADKTTGTWQLVEPEKTDADQGQLSNTASSLASLEITRVVDDNPTDLMPYGLTSAAIEVGFRLKGQQISSDSSSATRRPPAAISTPSCPDEKRVFLIASYLDNTFNRTPFDLRDKAVLKFERDKVDGLEIARAGNTIQLAKSGGEWTS